VAQTLHVTISGRSEREGGRRIWWFRTGFCFTMECNYCTN